MVTKTRKKYVMTKEHSEKCRKIAQEYRKEHREQVEIRLYNSTSIDDKQRLDYKLRDYFTNLNALIFWRNKTDEEININVVIRNLEYKLGRKLDGKWGDVALFLTMYNKNMRTLDLDNPYPNTLTMIKSGYETRRTLILESKKQAIDDLKIILGEK